MDDQLRNRFRRYDSPAPIRPRPHAPPQQARPMEGLAAPSQPTPPPAPAAVQPQPQDTDAWLDTPATAQPMQPAPFMEQPQPVTESRREPIPPRQPMQWPDDLQDDFPKVPARTAQLPKRDKSMRRGKKKGRKLLLVFFLLLVLGGGGAAGYWFVLKPRLHNKTVAQTTPAVTTAAQKTGGKLLRLVAVGDSMDYNSINAAAQSTGSYNYVPMMSAIKPLFDKTAVRICSQTVPAAGSQPVSGPPTFNAPPQFAQGLESIGCNVMDLASPNTNDKGQAGIDGTRSNFDKQDTVFAVAGANRSADEQNKISYFTVDGLKFAYLSYTTSTNVANPTPYGVNIYSDALADKQIKEARQNAALIIVSMHWGTDQAATENSDQDTIAQHLAGDNVDIVIGNGPHVIQPVKVLNGSSGHQTIVWFSLGNFLNSPVPIEDLVGGMAVMDIDTSTQQLHNPRILPLYMHYEWTAEQKARHNDADLLARKNFQLVPLDKAADLLAKSQNNTTVQAQQDRVKSIVNKYFTIPVITSNDL